MQADKELVSTVTLVNSLLLRAALRARVALLGSSRQRPEAEAARRAREASSKMNLDKHSVTDVSMVHSPAVQEALSVEFVLLASSPRLVHPSVRSVLQVDTETLLEDPLVLSAKLVSFLLDLVTMNVALARLVSSLQLQASVLALHVQLVSTRTRRMRLHAVPVLLVSSLPVWAIRFVDSALLASSLHQRAPLYARLAPLVNIKILLVS